MVDNTVVDDSFMNIDVKWISLEEVDWNTQSAFIRVDTRDFYVLVQQKEREIANIERLIELNKESKYKLFCTFEEVKQYLFRFREESGGDKSTWRFFELDIHGKGSWQLKYLSIFKTIEGYLIYPGSEQRALYKYELDSKVITERNKSE